MELKTLYRHWEKYTEFQSRNLLSADEGSALLLEILEFANERMLIWEKKQSNESPPYTSDPILREFRFCNIYRELDRQTIEIHRDLNLLRDDFSLWLMNLAFHRFVCRPETVKQVGHLSFDPANNKEVFESLDKLARPKYGTAYVFPISVIQRSEYPTREQFFCNYLPLVIPKIAELIQSFNNETVNAALAKILPVFGFNFRFHWTEILIDIAYQFPELVDLSRDFHIGPGAMPTLERLSDGLDLNVVLNNLTHCPFPDFRYLTFAGKNVMLSAENWEGIACEFRKYTNLRAGQGRRRKF